MKKIFLVAVLISPLALHAQVTATVSTDIQIFPTTTRTQTEESISINKNNPSQIMVSANDCLIDSPSYNQGIFVSNDGGLTWDASSNTIPNQGTGVLMGLAHPGGDPATSFDASGTAYLVSLLSSNGYLVETNDNAGVSSWSDPVGGETTPGGGFDKEMITTVDEMSTSLYANYFYAAFTQNHNKIYFNSLPAGSTTFSTPVQISDSTGPNESCRGTSIQTGPDGQVYICWADAPSTGLGNFAGAYIGFNSFTDGGVTPVTVVTGSTDIFSYAGIAKTGPNAADASCGGIRMNDFPAMAVDKSCGTYRGRIYIAYPEYDAGGKAIIKVIHSDDEGATWGDSVTASLTSSSSPAIQQAFFPAIAVDDLTGLVNIAYYALDGTGSSYQTNTYVAYSSDGGSTWQNIVVSSASHFPVRLALTAGLDTFYTGDYIGIATYANQSYIAFHDNRNSINGGLPGSLWNVFVTHVTYNLPTIASSTTNLNIANPTTISGNATFQAAENLTAATTNAVSIASTADVNFYAGGNIVLSPGYFSAPAGSVFLAEITSPTTCNTPGALTYKTKNTSFAGILANGNNNILTDTAKNKEVYAYPVPANDFITIGCYNNINAHTITISDIMGKTVMQIPVTIYNNVQLRNSINISSLAPGTYIFTIDFMDQAYSNKFIKQ